MFTREWAAAAFQRAVRTFAQTAVALIGTTAVIEGVDWALVASGAGLAAILSVLTSLGGLPEVGQPVLVQTNVYNPVATEPHERWHEGDSEAEADRQAAANDHNVDPYV